MKVFFFFLHKHTLTQSETQMHSSSTADLCDCRSGAGGLSMRLLSAPLVCRIGEKLFSLRLLLFVCPQLPRPKEEVSLGAFVWQIELLRTAGALHQCKGNYANESEVCRVLVKFDHRLVCLVPDEKWQSRGCVTLAPLYADGGDTLSFHHACFFWHHMLADVVNRFVCVCVCSRLMCVSLFMFASVRLMVPHVETFCPREFLLASTRIVTITHLLNENTPSIVLYKADYND